MMLAEYSATELGTLMTQFFLGVGGLIGAIFAGLALKEARKATEASRQNKTIIEEKVLPKVVAIDEAVNGKAAGEPTISEQVDATKADVAEIKETVQAGDQTIAERVVDTQEKVTELSEKATDANTGT